MKGKVISMKKKVWVTLLAVMMAATLPMSALAARSPSTSASSDDDDSYTTTTTAPANGLADSTSDGKSLTTNGAGVLTENIAAAFALGTAATAGLPEAVVAAINGINTGADLATMTGNPDLAGYSALTQTVAVVLQDKTTNTVANKETTVTLYIPNLIEGLQNVKILYYENATGLWKVVDPVAIDFSKKTVTFTMFGSGTVTVIHK